jgi:methylglyoxal synthase
LDPKLAPTRRCKTVALIAHDNKERDLLEWALLNRDTLANHKLVAAGTTGQLLEEELSLPVCKLRSGPLGGDQQIGAKIAEGEIESVVFFWDPLYPSSRHRREGSLADSRRLQHSYRVQPLYR